MQFVGIGCQRTTYFLCNQVPSLSLVPPFLPGLLIPRFLFSHCLKRSLAFTLFWPSPCDVFPDLRSLSSFPRSSYLFFFLTILQVSFFFFGLACFACECATCFLLNVITSTLFPSRHISSLNILSLVPHFGSLLLLPLLSLSLSLSIYLSYILVRLTRLNLLFPQLVLASPNWNPIIKNRKKTPLFFVCFLSATLIAMLRVLPFWC